MVKENLQRLRKAYVEVVHDDAEYSRQRWQLDIQLESPNVFDDVAPQIVSNWGCVPLVGCKPSLDFVGALSPAYPANYHPFLRSTRLTSPLR